MNAIGSIKATWQKPTLCRFEASEALKAELLTQSEARSRAAAKRR